MNTLTKRKHPTIPLTDLDTLWFQVSGTLCNLSCSHCFISCSPKNDTHQMIPRERMLRMLSEAEELGVKEYYFTGGEPFLHPELLEFIEVTLNQGPLTVLTNGMLITEKKADRLAELAHASRYSLDFRVSLDGLTPEENDEIRGQGTFAKIMRGVRRLETRGITPIITVTEVREGMGSADGRLKFFELLREYGLQQPRLKFLPTFQIGAEAERTCGYAPDQYVYADDLIPGEEEFLQCADSRMITADGLFPCPILINHPDAKMGESLAKADQPTDLRWSACYTCHISGVSCKN